MRADGLAWQVRKRDLLKLTELAIVHGCRTGERCYPMPWWLAFIFIGVAVGGMAYRWWRRRGRGV
jgi:hypothetical protein